MTIAGKEHTSSRYVTLLFLLVLLTLMYSWLLGTDRIFAMYNLNSGASGNTDGIPRDLRKFLQSGKAIQDDTPGALMRNGGYCWRDVLVTKQKYLTNENRTSSVTVEVVHHSSGYPYVIHDFFSTFRGYEAPNRRPPGETRVVNGVVEEEAWHWSFIVSSPSHAASVNTICVTFVARDTDRFGGNVGWYSRAADHITTVMMFFDKLDGIPVELIDKYLVKYPSSVKESDFHGETWVADDIQKWIHLLQLHKSDKVMFDMALGHLAAYDKNFFGDRDAFLTAQAAVRAGDTATVEKVVQDLKLDAERWLQNRATKNRQKKGD